MKLHANFEQADGMLIGCAVNGHAAYSGDDPSGQILCAAVSSAMQLTCNTLTECFHAAVAVTAHPDAGAQNRLAFRLEKPDAVQAGILQGLLLHFQVLAEDFDGQLTVKINGK